MNPENTLLVQQSFRWLLPGAELAGAAFLARLSGEAPELAQLLPAAGADQRRLLAAIAFTVSGLDDFETMLPVLRAAGSRLRELGVDPAAYDRFGAVLLGTLAQALGPAWNRHLSDAWAEAWTALAAAMQANGEVNRVAA